MTDSCLCSVCNHSYASVDACYCIFKTALHGFTWLFIADIEAAEYIIENYSVKEVQHVPIICATGW